MDANRDHHTKRSKSERQIPYDITYMWNLKYNTNISMNEKQTHREQICGCHQGSRTGGEKDWESGINRRKLA